MYLFNLKTVSISMCGFLRCMLICIHILYKMEHLFVPTSLLIGYAKEVGFNQLNYRSARVYNLSSKITNNILYVAPLPEDL